MNDFTNRLERQLMQLGDEIDELAAQRVRSDVARSRLHRRRAGIALSAGAGAAAILAVVAVLNIASLREVDKPSAPNNAPRAQGGLPGDGLPIVEPGEPCPAARHASSPDNLQTNVPHWEPANRNVTDAWTCGDTPVLLYGPIQVSYEDGWKEADAQRKFDALALDYGGSVEVVLGRPAWIHPADDAGPNNSVMVVVGDILIRLLADTSTPIKDLVELAETIELPAKMQR